MESLERAQDNIQQKTKLHLFLLKKTIKRKNLRFWCFEGKGNAPVPPPLAVAQRKQVGFLHHFRHVLSTVGLCNSN
jgi:hypothetical protein